MRVPEVPGVKQYILGVRTWVDIRYETKQGTIQQKYGFHSINHSEGFEEPWWENDERYLPALLAGITPEELIWRKAVGLPVPVYYHPKDSTKVISLGTMRRVLRDISFTNGTWIDGVLFGFVVVLLFLMW